MRHDSAGLTTKANTGPFEHLPALDGLRGVAVLLVVWFHLQSGAFVGPIARFFQASAMLGFIGVDLFLVLSGFLITGILLSARESEHYFKSFYMRRTLRIFPLYYVTLFLWHFLAPATAVWSAGEVARFHAAEPWYWVYLANVYAAFGGATGDCGTAHLWSLQVEEQFYLLWPLFLWWARPARHARLCLALIVAAVVFRLVLLACHVGYDARVTLLPARMDALALGGLLAVLRRDRSHWRLVSVAAPWALGVGALALVAMVLVALAIHNLGAVKGVFMPVGGFTLLAAWFAALIAIVVDAPRGGWVTRVLVQGPLVFVGKYSYAIYLFHYLLAQPLRLAVAPWQGAWTGTLRSGVGSLLFTGVGLGLSMLLALVSWHGLERPLLSLKRHFRY